MKDYETFKTKGLPNYLCAYEIVRSGLQMKQTKLPFSAHVALCGYCNLPSIILAGLNWSHLQFYYISMREIARALFSHPFDTVMEFCDGKNKKKRIILREKRRLPGEFC